MNSKKKANKSKFKVVFGYILLFSSLVLFASFISYIFNWKDDQSNVDMIFDKDVEVEMRLHEQNICTSAKTRKNFMKMPI